MSCCCYYCTILVFVGNLWMLKSVHVIVDEWMNKWFVPLKLNSPVNGTFKRLAKDIQEEEIPFECNHSQIRVESQQVVRFLLCGSLTEKTWHFHSHDGRCFAFSTVKVFDNSFGTLSLCHSDSCFVFFCFLEIRYAVIFLYVGHGWRPTWIASHEDIELVTRAEEHSWGRWSQRSSPPTRDESPSKPSYEQDKCNPFSTERNWRSCQMPAKKQAKKKKKS